MRNLYILIIFFIFIMRKEELILGASSALSFWSKNLFPILFPTFIIVDLLLSSTLIKYVSDILGFFFKKVFRTSKSASFVFILSMLSGTPTNVKILKRMYDNGSISSKDITKILSFTFFFNPFLIISFAGIKVLLIIWISNILTGIILRNFYVSEEVKTSSISIPFSLQESTRINMDIMLNILGTITVFMCLSYIIPFISPLFNALSSSFLELSTALYKNKLYFSSEYIYIFMLAIGGVSIFMQIKSILKDTLIDYKFIVLSRIITLIIALLICFLT